MNGQMCFCLVSFTFENTIWSMFVKNRLRQQAVFLRLGNLSSLLPSISFFSCFGRLQNGNSSLLRASSLRCWRWRLLGLRMAKLVYFGDTVGLATVLLFTTPVVQGQKELGHLVKAEQLTWWMVFFWIDLSPLKELWPKRPLWSLGMQLWCERVSLDYPSTVLCGGSRVQPQTPWTPWNFLDGNNLQLPKISRTGRSVKRIAFHMRTSDDNV